MTNKNRFSKPVAFNTKNEQDNIILEYSKRRNFSGFAKKAMLEYIENHKKNNTVKEVVKDVPKEKPIQEIKKDQVKLTPIQKPQASDRMARMKEELKNKKPGISPGPKMFNQK